MQGFIALCAVDLLREDPDEEVLAHLRKIASELDPRNSIGILERLERKILDMQLVHSKPVSNWRADVQILVQEIVSPQEIAWMDDDAEDAVYVRRAIKEVQVRLKK